MKSVVEQIVGTEMYSNLSPLARTACERVRAYYTQGKKLRGRFDKEKQAIDDAIWEKNGVTLDTIMKKSRMGEMVELRGMIWTIFRDLTGSGITEQQRIFGWDHSTIYHNINICRDRMMYRDYAQRFNELKESVKQKLNSYE